MHELPHHYKVAAAAVPDSNVELTSPGVDTIESAPPVEFDGPGDRWSPEALLVAAVADCLVLTFRAIARGFRMEWNELSCDVVGVLDKAEGTTRFTRFDVEANLVVPAGTDEAKAIRLVEKAEYNCLITNSLIAESDLTINVVVAD